MRNINYVDHLKTGVYNDYNVCFPEVRSQVINVWNIDPFENQHWVYVSCSQGIT